MIEFCPRCEGTRSCEVITLHEEITYFESTVVVCSRPTRCRRCGCVFDVEGDPDPLESLYAWEGRH